MSSDFEKRMTHLGVAIAVLGLLVTICLPAPKSKKVIQAIDPEISLVASEKAPAHTNFSVAIAFNASTCKRAYSVQLFSIERLKDALIGQVSVEIQPGAEVSKEFVFTPYNFKPAASRYLLLYAVVTEITELPEDAISLERNGVKQPVKGTLQRTLSNRQDPLNIELE